MQATLLTLAIAAILALLAALLGPYFVDWTAHRATFEQHASQALGLPVRVTGPMDVRLLPTPTLVLSGVEIGEANDPQALRAKALGIEFALTPLLSGHLRAVEFRLVAPEMQVALNKDGEAVLPNALAGINIQALSIDKLVVEDASLRLADAASGTSAFLSKLWFTGEVRAIPGPIRGEGAFVMDGALYGYRVATGRPEPNGSRIKLSIDPADRPVFAEAEGVVSAPDGVPRFEGSAVIARRVQPKGDKGAIAEPWQISARVKASAASALFEQVEYQYGPDDRALKLTGTAEATFGARPQLNAVLTARTLDADKLLGGVDAGHSPRTALAGLVAAVERIIGPPLPTQVGFGIDQLTLGGGTLQNIRGDIEFADGKMVLSGFELRAPGLTQLQASGRLEKSDGHLSFAGPIAVTSTDPRAFAEWLDGKSGASTLPARPLRFRGEVTLGAHEVAIERMEAEFDGKAFAGDLSYAFAAGAPVRLAATLRADELDVDALMETARLVKLPAERPDELSLSLALKRVRFGGLEGGEANVALALKAGALSIERFALKGLAGLSIDGKGKVDVEAQRGSVSFDVAVRDAQGLAGLAKYAPERLAEPLQRAAEAAAPGNLKGTITVEPAGSAGNSRATLSLGGPLGAVDLKLKSVATGRWSEARQAEVSLDASLASGDVNALLKLAGAERVVAAPRQPGTYTLSLQGALAGDLRIDSRIASANLDMRAQGNVRPFGNDAGNAALDIAIAKAEIVPPGAMKPIPVALKTKLVRDGLGLRFDDVSATVAGAVVRGRLSLVFDEPLAVDGELRTDRLDIPTLLHLIVGGANAAKGDPLWSETPFALSALPKLAGRMNVSSAQATLTPSLPVTKFRSALRFAESEVKVEDVAGEMLGGRLSGDLTIRRAADAIGLQGKITVSDADATQLLFGDGAAPLTGQATLTLNLEGMGRSPRALVGSLNGTGTLTLDHLRIAALNPGVFATAMTKVDQGLPIDAPRVTEVAKNGLDAGPLVVPHAEATLTIAAGVARIDTFKAKAEAADLAVTGSYDLSNARIDLRLAMAGPAAGAPLQPQIAVQLRGPSAAPERVLDVSSLTGWLALRSVERQTKKIEAIEQGRPVEEAPAPPQKEKEAAPQGPDTTAQPPRRKPPQAALQPAEPAQPLPPAVEIGPAPGERRRALPQVREPRIETQRAEPQRSGGANPFPTPIGSPPPRQPPVARPVPPQPVRPVF